MDLRDVDKLFVGYAPECVRVLSKDGGYVPLELNRAQRRQMQHHITSHKRRFIVPKARQMGTTTLYLARHLFRAQVLDGFTTGFITLKGEVFERASLMLREMYRRQPKAWQAQAPKLVKETDNLLQFENGSRIILTSQGGTAPFRGESLQCLDLSEFAHYDDPEQQMAASLPALSPTGELIIESSPNGFNQMYELYQEAKDDPNSPYCGSFYEWWWADEYSLPAPADFQATPEELALMQAHSLTSGQILWRRQAQRDYRRLFAQEYPESDEECWLSTGDSVFSYEAITALKAVCKAPTSIEYDGLLRLWFTEGRPEPFAGTPYVIGADCAEGVPNGDYSAATIQRAKSGTHMGTLMDDPPFPQSRERRMDPNTFARLLNEVGRRFNMALIDVERNGPGRGVVALLQDVYHYPNLATHEGKVGFQTNAPTKTALVSNFRNALDSDDFSTFDARMPRQMSDFVVLDRKGDYEKVGARSGAKDDLMMAGMIGNQARANAMIAYASGPTVITLHRW